MHSWMQSHASQKKKINKYYLLYFIYLKLFVCISYLLLKTVMTYKNNSTRTTLLTT